MDLNQRENWVKRGFNDPKKAYRQHAAHSVPRGIEFDMTFAEWWSYWENHYENRGVRSGQMQMCRTGDKGGYTVGNVRIDTVKGNAQERALEGMCVKATFDRSVKWQGKPPGGSSRWMNRGHVFDEYTEDEEENVQMVITN